MVLFLFVMEKRQFCHGGNGKNKKEGMSFFPLTVDYEEKFYAAGRIMGGRFMKREGTVEEAILTARIIDRTIRPMFDKD